MKIVTETWGEMKATRIYPWLEDDADTRFDGYVVVTRLPHEAEGAITINAQIDGLTVGQTLELIVALERAVVIAQVVTDVTKENEG